MEHCCINGEKKNLSHQLEDYNIILFNGNLKLSLK